MQTTRTLPYFLAKNEKKPSERKRQRSKKQIDEVRVVPLPEAATLHKMDSLMKQFVKLSIGDKAESENSTANWHESSQPIN